MYDSPYQCPYQLFHIHIFQSCSDSYTSLVFCPCLYRSLPSLQGFQQSLTSNYTDKGNETQWPIDEQNTVIVKRYIFIWVENFIFIDSKANQLYDISEQRFLVNLLVLIGFQQQKWAEKQVNLLVAFLVVIAGNSVIITDTFHTQLWWVVSVDFEWRILLKRNVMKLLSYYVERNEYTGCRTIHKGFTGITKELFAQLVPNFSFVPHIYSTCILLVAIWHASDENQWGIVSLHEVAEPVNPWQTLERI